MYFSALYYSLKICRFVWGNKYLKCENSVRRIHFSEKNVSLLKLETSECYWRFVRCHVLSDGTGAEVNMFSCHYICKSFLLPWIKIAWISSSNQFLLFCTVKIFCKARGRTGKQMFLTGHQLWNLFPLGPPEVKKKKTCQFQLLADKH